MFKAELEYRKDCLYVTVSGNVRNEDVRGLKLRMYRAMKEYEIDHIVIDVKGAQNIQIDTFYEFINKYDLGKNQSLEIVEY